VNLLERNLLRNLLEELRRNLCAGGCHCIPS
jgi:hypothetical protein